MMCTPLTPSKAATEAFQTLNSAEIEPRGMGMAEELYVACDSTGDCHGYVGKPELHATGFWDAGNMREKFALPDALYKQLGLNRRECCRVEISVERLPEHEKWTWTVDEEASK